MAETSHAPQPARPPGGGTSRSPPRPRCALRELPFLTQLNLRLDPAGPAGEAVAEVLGAPLPTRSYTAASARVT